ncbi:MAG: hypothetical protein M0Z94_09225 [Dehalococcoidales bacterium]|nr:hypothetical protein [Dehalococcoidales bacterium]
MDQSIVDMRNQLQAMSLEIEAALAGLTEADLNKPANWTGKDTNVRFLLHRLTAHVLDHTLQIRKARRAMGIAPSETQMILSQFMEAEAAMLGECAGLSAEQFEKGPAAGEWSAKQVLEHVLTTQKKALESIQAAASK